MPAAPAPVPPTAPAEVDLGPIDPAWVTSGNTSPAGPSGALRAVVEVRVAPAARVTADVNTLGRKLPMRLADLVIDAIAKGTESATLPIDARLLAALAPDRAVAIVVVHGKEDDRSPQCVAFPFARAADASATAERIGPALSRRGGAIERQTGSGQRRWTAIKDGALLLADSYDVLFGGCAQALAATREPLPAEEVVAIINLDALFRQLRAKRDLATEFGDQLAKAARASERASAAQAPAKRGAGPRLSPEAMRRLGQQMGRALMQSARARFALSASA